MRYNWAKIEPHFGKLTDCEMADRFNVSRIIIANRRIGKGVKPVTKWERYKHLLGTMPDKDLAKLIGASPNSVTVKRIREGILRFGANPEGKLEDAFCATLKESYDRQVTTPMGRIDILTPTMIYECKRKLNLSGLHRAIGQLICYGSIFPDRRKVIVCSKITVPVAALELLDDLMIGVIVIDFPH